MPSLTDEGEKQYWLGFIRGRVGAQITDLAELFDLPVRKPLKQWLPRPDRDEQNRRELDEGPSELT